MNRQDLIDLRHHFDRISARDRDKLARYLVDHIDRQFHHLEIHMTALDDAIASAQAKVSALTAEVATANTKIDALIALAQGAGVSQAQLDAVAAIGTSADSGLAALQAEEAEIPAPPPAP